MPERRRFMTPFIKQLIVVAGLSCNKANLGSVLGFPAILLPQLTSDPEMRLDKNTGSWIASIIGISLFLGNLTVPALMGKFGRKPMSIFTCSALLVGWIWLALATEVTSILIARFIQGLAVGMNYSLIPIMVGEMTSPINRGILSALTSSSITGTTVMAHILGSYFHWQITALACACTTAFGLAILIFIPETPSWLADKGRYTECEGAFRWLRDEAEEEELENMLEAHKAKKEVANNSKSSFIGYVINMIKKREFYKPILIVVHLNTISLWSGLSFLIVYLMDIIKIVAGNVDVPLHVTLLDVQRFISTIIGVLVIKKLKRRTIFVTTVGVNLAVMVILAVYTFAKTKYPQIDNAAVSMTLMHIHMCSMTVGALPLPLILSGELFPLEFRSLGGGISAVAYSLNYFITTKSVVFLLSTIDVYGAYMLYSVVTAYCMVVVWIYLPETKDKTLQDIENEFKGKSKIDTDVAETLPLNGRDIEMRKLNEVY